MCVCVCYYEYSCSTLDEYVCIVICDLMFFLLFITILIIITARVLESLSECCGIVSIMMIVATLFGTLDGWIYTQLSFKS